MEHQHLLTSMAGQRRQQVTNNKTKTLRVERRGVKERIKYVGSDGIGRKTRDGRCYACSKVGQRTHHAGEAFFRHVHCEREGDVVTERTQILPKRQKLIGLSANGGGKVTDDTLVSELKAGKNSKSKTMTLQFILMGTPEEHIFVDPHEKDDLPDVIDDFDLDFNAGSEQWVRHVATGQNLKKFTESTVVHIMNEPREGKPLMVLDLDHTLLDFSSRNLLRDTSTHRVGDGSAAKMKRPFMDDFLATAYQHYDLVVWSQTSWRWLETKLTELGMLTDPRYKFCFVLDKTSMFAITSTKRDGSAFQHHVKPLQIIWTKFPRWNAHNTVHLDDLARNFALNLGSGLKVTAYYRKKNTGKRDVELSGLARYLTLVATAGASFEDIDFDSWQDVLCGKRSLTDKEKKASASSKEH